MSRRKLWITLFLVSVATSLAIQIPYVRTTCEYPPVDGVCAGVVEHRVYIIPLALAIVLAATLATAILALVGQRCLSSSGWEATSLESL
jgi:hypothetical protein